METAALILARSGSKRVPGKNRRLLGGRPLITYTFDHACAVLPPSHIYVSTDDEEIMVWATEKNLQLIQRPAHLATDHAKSIDAVRHALSLITPTPRYILLLQPTVPIREKSVIAEALEIIGCGCDSVISHIQVDFFHPNRLKCIEDGRVKPYYETEREDLSRDQLPPVYCRDGSIYLFRSGLPSDQDSLMGRDQRAVISSLDGFVNIDTEIDWLVAEALIRKFPTGLIE